MLNIPPEINDDVVLAYALANGYQQTVVVTPATPATLGYNGDVPYQIPAVAEVDGPNPQSPEDFVTDMLTNQMIAVYKSATIAVAVENAKQVFDDATAQATQSVEATIADAQNKMVGKLQTNII
jgi:hypothetical protein